jgi:hypothetical protein
MKCYQNILIQTSNGRIYTCNSQDKLTLMYKNISRVFSTSDFENFKTLIESRQLDRYFKKFSCSEKVFLHSGNPDFYLCFTKEEVFELRKMCDVAWFRFSLRQIAKRNLN